MYLLAGAITTVAVAWSTVWLAGYDLPDPIVYDSRAFSTAQDDGIERAGTVLLTKWFRPGNTIIMINYSDVPYATSKIERSFGVLPSVPGECRRYLHDWVAGVSKESDFRTVDLRGWPMLSMWCSPAESGGPVFHDARFGIPLEHARPATGWYFRWPTLPLRPLWRGFAINTSFYAAAWFVLMFGFVQLKRIIRARRGRCVMCGYQLENMSAGCSECGHGRTP